MTARRSHGDGGLHWDQTRQRWIATITTGYTPAGKRVVRKAAGRAKLKDLIRDHDDGVAAAERGYTVAQAVTDWLDYGLPGRDRATVDTKRSLATQHVIPALGARKLVDLSADEVDQWLVEKAASLSTRTVADLKSILRRAITRAQSRDKVRRNVVLLCGDVAAHRRPHRRTTGVDLEPPRPQRPARHRPARPAARHGLALGPRRR